MAKSFIGLTICLCVGFLGAGALAADWSRNPEDVVVLFEFFKDSIDPQKCSASFGPVQTVLKGSSERNSLIMNLMDRKVQKNFFKSNDFIFWPSWKPVDENDSISLVQSAEQRGANFVTAISVRLGLLGLPQYPDGERKRVGRALYLQVEHVGTQPVRFDVQIVDETSNSFCGRYTCSYSPVATTPVSAQSCLKEITD